MGPSRLRVLVSSSLAVASGIFVFTAAVALTRSKMAALLISTAVWYLIFHLVRTRPVVVLDEAACSRPLKIVSGLATILALVLLGRLAVFMVDSSRVEYSAIPGSKWEVGHSCLSAYYVSGRAASATPDIYADALFTAPDDDPKAPRKPLSLGSFKIDVFEYPPPFLLLPRAVGLLTPNFLQLRMLWFALLGAGMLVALLAVARALGPAAGTRALLLSPLVWASLPMIGTLQKGNVQGLVIAAAMLGMALFERRRWAAGGALLAFVTLSKLYPGLLLLYLLVQRQWRALAWTAAFGTAFVIATIADIGWRPFAVFFERLPALFGGEAFPAFRNPPAIAINLSIPGLAFKLGLFGVPGMSFGASKAIGWIYTPIVVAATVLAGLRARRDGENPLAWLAILILATLRSPFLPQGYGTIPSLWLLTLVAAASTLTPRGLFVVLVTWAALNFYWPIDWPIDPRLLALASAVPQVLTIGLAVIALRRARSS